MTVFPPDQRRVINPNSTEFTVFPFPAVTAIDSQIAIPLPGGGVRIEDFFKGSGIVISPNHVLTAAHVVHDEDNQTATLNVRASTSDKQKDLVSRNIGDPADVAAGRNPNISRISFLGDDFRLTSNENDDIALLKTNQFLLSPARVIGLIAFVDPKDAVGFAAETAGYPGDNVSQPISGNSGRVARDLVIAPGDSSLGTVERVESRRLFTVNNNIDNFRGQSGSGIWSSYQNDDLRVFGLLNFETPPANGGILITTDIYEQIINQIEADLGTDNADLLPENAIIGSDSFLSFGGNDNIFGTYRRERIIGNGGDDQLFGDGGDDRLEGGDGVDQALFSDSFTNSSNNFNYDWSITNPGNIENPEFEFKHNLTGNQSDGKDTIKEIEFAVFEFVDANKDGEDDDGELFFVPLQVDPDDPTKLKDGALIHPKEKVLDDEGEEIATITVESPAWMFDGDVKYNLSIGLDITESYNIAFIIDRSGSMSRDGRLTQTKDALTQLIDSFNESGIDSNIDYSVISFSDTPSRTDTSDSTRAKNVIDGLVASGATKFSGGLFQASDFFSYQFLNTTNLAYFISDGVPGDNPAYVPFAASLKALTDEVHAFGVAGATLSTLNVIDSDGEAEYLSSAGDLFDAFDTSIDRDTIDHIEVRLEGRDNPIQIISPDELTEKGFNLTYEGTIDGLEVSREAENNITFELVFKEETGIDNVLLDYKITTGQEEVRQQTNNGRNEVINFGVNQSDFTDSNNESFSLESAREIVGNSLGNTFQISDGSNTISGNGGNDRFVLFGGSNFVDGGDAG